MRGVAMVTILSSHQQNAMISTLRVLLLTLNKALPGGRPRITRVSLMVRLIFSLNKFYGSLVLKTGRAVISFPPFCLNTTPGTSISVWRSLGALTHTYILEITANMLNEPECKRPRQTRASIG